MPLIEHAKDWRKVFANYDIVLDRLPVKDELVYVSYVGIFTVDNVYENGDIDVDYNGKIKRFPTSHYRLLERRTLRPTFRDTY